MTPARIVDLTVAGTRYDVIKAALDILTTAPEFDMVLAVVGSSARFHPELAVRPMIDSANAAKPIAAFLVPEAPEALAQLARGRRAELPHAGSLRGCHRGGARAARAEAGSRARRGSAASGRVLDELEAYALLDRLGVPRAPAVALDTTIAQAPALPFALSGRREGPVRRHPAQDRSRRRRAECARRRRAASPPSRRCARPCEQRTGITPERVLVAPMVSGIGEALIGYRVDREAGPLIMVAAGGVLHRNLPRPQPAPRAGRSADRACDDRRGEGLRHAEGLPRQAGRRSRRAGARPSWRCRSWRCRMTRRSPRPRSIR